MELQKHHKIMIGGFSSFLIILLVANSVFIYLLYGQLQLSYNQIESDINKMKSDNQERFSEITDTLLQTKDDISIIETGLESLDVEVSSIGQEFNELKADVSSDFSGIVEDAIKSVVTIKTNVGQGTGFIISKEGHIVTNYHVIEDETSPKGIVESASIYTYDGEMHSVSLIGYDENMDVALLKIGESYPKLELADSDDISQAEKVIAIGNPYGLSFSVSEGIVSAIHREGPNGLDIYIQTTAELNAGNSGGPLINKNGKVIGMNNFKLSDSEGLGFALESNYIKSTVNDIAQKVLGQTLI